MASPSLLRSAAGRVLRRSSPQGPSPRIPRVFFSGVAGRIEPCKMMVLDQLETNLREMQGLVDIMVEQDKRFQRNEQLQKKIGCVLLPATAALYIFGPDKKEKPPAEGQAAGL